MNPGQRKIENTQQSNQGYPLFCLTAEILTSYTADLPCRNHSDDTLINDARSGMPCAPMPRIPPGRPNCRKCDN